MTENLLDVKRMQKTWEREK